jgi:energy-coupling factor transporter ATP-binding protein EcfA2
LHALIGPNNSGKSSIIEAIDALFRSTDHRLDECFPPHSLGTDLVNSRSHRRDIEFSTDVLEPGVRFTYMLGLRFGHLPAETRVIEERFDRWVEGRPLEPEVFEFPTPAMPDMPLLTGVNYHNAVLDAQSAFDWPAGVGWHAMHGSLMIRWSPRYLALPVAPDLNRRFRIEKNGFGLAQCLDEILSHDRRRFEEIESQFCSHFPEVSSIRLQLEEAYSAPADSMQDATVLSRSAGKGIRFVTSGDGKEMAASQASDGMLLLLAYLTVSNLPLPPKLLLIEEPENGIHPKRFKELIQLLRSITERERWPTQVILTTHSPLVLNLLRPEEVTLCRRNEVRDVETRRLDSSKPVSEQSDFFTLGEIWTLDGDDGLMEAATEDSSTGGQ